MQALSQVQFIYFFLFSQSPGVNGIILENLGQVFEIGFYVLQGQYSQYSRSRYILRSLKSFIPGIGPSFCPQISNSINWVSQPSISEIERGIVLAWVKFFKENFDSSLNPNRVSISNALLRFVLIGLIILLCSQVMGFNN